MPPKEPKAPKKEPKAEKPPKKKEKPKAAEEAEEPKRPVAAALERRSQPRLSIYEFTSLVGERATQLSRGAVPFVALPPDFKTRSNMELCKIAIEEIRQKVLPRSLLREMPDGAPSEVWTLDELHIPEHFFSSQLGGAFDDHV